MKKPFSGSSFAIVAVFGAALPHPLALARALLLRASFCYKLFPVLDPHRVCSSCVGFAGAARGGAALLSSLSAKSGCFCRLGFATDF